MVAIETFGLTKKYLPPRGLKALLMKSPIKSEVTAVNKVNLTVKEGELFGLIGPNGAGKTTLIKMLSTLLWPTSGKALINGYDLFREEEEAKASIGFVSGEERSFYWRLTGRQNLQFFASLHNLPSKLAKKRINEVLAQVGLEKVADNMYYSYSSGMKQKLALARGLLTDPLTLFLDEPTKSVDVVTAQNLKEFIKNSLVKEQKRTVFLTTHRLEEAEQLCDHIALMDRGKIGFYGTITEFKKVLAGKERYIIQVKDLSLSNLEKVIRKRNLSNFTTRSHPSEAFTTLEFSSTNGDSSLPEVIRDILESGGNIISCQKQEPPLEEVFIERLKSSEAQGEKDAFK